MKVLVSGCFNASMFTSLNLFSCCTVYLNRHYIYYIQLIWAWSSWPGQHPNLTEKEPVSDWTSTCISELLQLASLTVSDVLICKTTSLRQAFTFSACPWEGLDRQIIDYIYRCIFVLSKHMWKSNLKMLKVLVWISNEKPKGVKSNKGAKMPAEVRRLRNLKRDSPVSVQKAEA